MEQHIISMLEKKHPDDNLVKLLDDIKSWIKYSRGRMNSRHSAWDHNYKVFKGERMSDEQDLEARENDEPEKMIVPMSYTQVMTFVTFVFMLFKQNRTFFEFNAEGSEDYVLQETCETFLERDLRHNDFDVKLFQALLDIARFGIGVTKTTWKIETQKVRIEVPGEEREVQGLTVTSEPQTLIEDAIKYEGNEIVNISPYRILPDMRLPLTRWKEGQFIADEEEFHISYFKKLEREGLAVGVKHVNKMDKTIFGESGRTMDRFSQMSAEFSAKKDSTDEDNFMVVSTDGHYKIVPADYGLGEETYPVDFLITYLNDSRIISIRRADYLHDQFVYDMGQFTPDLHAKLNLALADTVDALQETITWLFNSRLISLRQGLDKHLVVDPSVFDMTDLESRSPIIKMKKGAPKTGISNFIQQLKISDPTVQNVPEAETLMKIMQIVTGVNENAMGQYSPGRRSATENRAANQGAASRMVLHARLIWVQLLSPLGLKMLSNLRQGVSEETFVKVIGEQDQSAEMDNATLYSLFCPSDPRALIGSEDFFVFDGTNQSEKQYMAQTMQELIVAMLSNPEVAMLTQYDLTKMIDENLQLKGIRNVARLKRPQTPVGPNLPIGPDGQPIQPAMPGTPGLPPNPALQALATGAE